LLQVIATWALEMESYNEWMNEEDYEVDEFGKKKSHRVCMIAMLLKFK
jgi:SWI/SNF related-matrix-associated actin-dependent regulator of chromatin subfamily C